MTDLSSPLHKEAQLLIYLARTRLDENLKSKVTSLLRSRLDWKQVYTAAQAHGVLSLVYTGLNKHFASLVPHEILREFKLATQNTSVVNLTRTSTLIQLLTLFSEHRIAIVPFKGPLLACSVYGNLALRSFGDLDILIRSRDVTSAYALLKEKEYEPEINLTQKQIAKLIKTEDNLSFVHVISGTIVELHWELSGNYLPQPLTLETIEPRLFQDNLLGYPVFSLSNEDLLIYLCIHGSKHIWNRLEWICCLHELISKNSDIDWDQGFSLAEKWSAKQMLTVGLLITSQLLATPIPEETVYILKKNKTAVKMASMVCESFKNLTEMQNQQESRFSYWQLQCADSVQGGLRIILIMLFAPTIEDWRRVPLPAHLSFLYYLIRPIRLMWNGLKKV